MSKLKTNKSVLSPTLGIYLDRPPIELGPRMLQDGLNFRIKEGRLTNDGMGWTRFGTFALNGPVLLIDNFFISGGIEKLIFASKTDLYVYDSSASTVRYITPIYSTGTASAAGTAVTGVGTAWLTNAQPFDEINFGFGAETRPGQPWYTITNVGADNAITLSSSPGVVANGPYTIRRKFTGAEENQWVTETFVKASPSGVNEWWATNGVDTIVRWNGTDDTVEKMSALGFTCKSLKVYDNMMIFMNLVQGGTTKSTDMINSNPGEPQNVTTGLSEQFKVHSGNDQILRGINLGDNLIIYSENTITVAQFVGDPLTFIFRNAEVGKGPIGIKAIARFPDYHLFIGKDTEYNFDGATARRVGAHVWRNLLRARDPDRGKLAYSHIDEGNGELIWVLPRADDVTTPVKSTPPKFAAMEYYLEPVGDKMDAPVSFRDFPFTATGHYTKAEGTTWDQLTMAWSAMVFRWSDLISAVAFEISLAGDSSGKIYELNTSINADGAALASFVKFGRRPTADGKMRALIRRLYPFVSNQTTSILALVHLADHARGTSTINTALSFDQTLQEGIFFVPVYRRGRYVEVEFGTAGPSQAWELSGYDLDIVSGGQR